MSVSTSAATAAIKRSKWKFTTASAFTSARANPAKTDKLRATDVAALAAASAEAITRRLTHTPLHLQQRVQIERLRAHRQSTVGSARPFFMRAVAIKFDAVPIGIAQIKRFADAVIACAVKRNLRHVQAAQRVGQFGACRIQNGEMIKAGCSMRWRTSARALPSVQTDVMMITPAETNAASSPWRCINSNPSTPQ